MKVLVVGAKPDSLGDQLARQIRSVEDLLGGSYDWTVFTAGISGQEDLLLDVRSYSAMLEVLADLRPDHIVCTVGINNPQENYRTMSAWFEDHLAINCVGPMRLLEAWMAVQPMHDPVSGRERHFVAVSSNSAHIARRDSAAYCASKAALSMALRVRGREMATGGMSLVVHGYEPGLLFGTPMTEKVANRFSGSVLHRMPGIHPGGLSPMVVSRLILRDLLYGGRELNGVMQRIDAGEQ